MFRLVLVVLAALVVGACAPQVAQPAVFDGSAAKPADAVRRAVRPANLPPPRPLPVHTIQWKGDPIIDAEPRS